jgi:hypothetical protein
MIHYMVRYFLLGVGLEKAELDTRLRLILHSFLEDGEYARELFDTIFERVHPLFAASLEAAAAAGDLALDGVTPANRFWFGHHIAAMWPCPAACRASIAYQGGYRIGRRGQPVHPAWDRPTDVAITAAPAGGARTRLNSRSLDVLGQRWTATR